MHSCPAPSTEQQLFELTGICTMSIDTCTRYEAYHQAVVEQAEKVEAGLITIVGAKAEINSRF